MEEGTVLVNLWINWIERIVSFQEVPGFERLPFHSDHTLQANLQILLAEGFRFQ